MTKIKGERGFALFGLSETEKSCDQSNGEDLRDYIIEIRTN